MFALWMKKHYAWYDCRFMWGEAAYNALINVAWADYNHPAGKDERLMTLAELVG